MGQWRRFTVITWSVSSAMTYPFAYTHIAESVLVAGSRGASPVRRYVLMPYLSAPAWPAVSVPRTDSLAVHGVRPGGVPGSAGPGGRCRRADASDGCLGCGGAVCAGLSPGGACRVAAALSAGELVDGGLGDGSEEVDEVAVGIAEQQRPVAPGHRGGLIVEVLDEAGQVPVHAVHVVDEELDDDSVVVGRPGGARREQRNGAGAGDREGGGGGSELSEVLVRPARLPAGGALVEPGQAGGVVGDDADRDEIHGDLPVSGNVLHHTLEGIPDTIRPVSGRFFWPWPGRLLAFCLCWSFCSRAASGRWPSLPAGSASMSAPCGGTWATWPTLTCRSSRCVAATAGTGVRPGTAGLR